ncbi:amidohydrolase [Sulfitobacter sp. MF3-043]|uniref:amidohydrolase n=1 Tax=Sulfitobacter sediminivivens TaxID=3252902 RepID=UPI0036D9AC56
MTASILFHNGPILTMDDQNSVAGAVLTIGDRIARVGRWEDLRQQAADGTEEVDLQGQTMIPAFIDPHGHFPDPGFITLFRVDLSSGLRGDCADIPTALARLAAKAAQTPKGEWVMGVLFDNTTIAERRMPTRAELDSVSTEHPIWVLHASGHNGVANSMTLDMREIDEANPDPVGGRFGRDPVTGRLTGLIEGLSAMGAMGDTDFLIDRERFWKGFDATRNEYLSYGVTAAQNAWATRALLDHFNSKSVDDDPGIDLTVLPIGELEPELSQGGAAMHRLANPHFTLGPRKLFADGAFQLQTAYLRDSYHRPINPEAPCGTPYMTAQELTAQVCKLHDLGFQIHCHCNGDAGADLFLDAVASALKANPRDDHRHTVIHGQLLHDDQLALMAKLGVTVSFFSAHIHFWGDRHADTFLGPERAEGISPAGAAERHGVRFTLHNDASVTPTRPIHLAHCAVNRMTATGQVLGPDQRISVLSALRAQTIDAAWQVFQEHERGSIEIGKLADFAVLNQNPLNPKNTLLATVTTRTVRRGKTVFRSSSP